MHWVWNALKKMPAILLLALEQSPYEKIILWSIPLTILVVGESSDEDLFALSFKTPTTQEKHQLQSHDYTQPASNLSG